MARRKAHGCPSHHPKPSPEHLAALLRENGLRVTGPRQAILNLLATDQGPFSAESIFKTLRGKARCDLATVYRVLAALEEIGKLRRCEFGDGVHRYELDAGDRGHHHHLVCRRCGSVEVIDACAVAALETDARERGYTDVTHVLELFGTCPGCAAKPAPRRPLKRAV
jgi:Fe2+ or Zn2+ uptake regulation protein